MALGPTLGLDNRHAPIVAWAGNDEGDDKAQLVCIFTYSKVIEFLNMVFMILEGRWREVSFLNVYHHVTTLSYWFSIMWMAPAPTPTSRSPIYSFPSHQQGPHEKPLPTSDGMIK